MVDGKDDIFSENLLALLSSSPNIWLFLRAHFSFICSHIPTNAAVSSLDCQKSFTSSTIISQNSILFETIKIDILLLLLIIIITLILITLAMSALIWLRVSASKTCGASSLPGLRHSVKPWLRWRWWSEEGFELPWASFEYSKSAQMPGLHPKPSFFDQGPKLWVLLLAIGDWPDDPYLENGFFSSRWSQWESCSRGYTGDMPRFP